jgi:hypothetical protein
MRMMRKFLVSCIFFLLIIGYAHALGIMGRDAKFHINVVPGYTQEDIFTITNNEGYTSSYEIVAVRMEGADMTEYFNITPNRIENISTGGATSTKVRVHIPGNVESPGVSEVWVKVQIDTTRGGGITATPSVAIRYIFSVLYPTTYINWGINAPNLNVNETKNFSVNIQNIGIPTLGYAYADVTVKSPDTNETYRNFRTDSRSNIKSWESVILNGEFDSRGLSPGDYMANFTLHYDENISSKETIFRIGTKDVHILNFTKLFEKDSINKMDIIVESAWNKHIQEIYADVTVYDIETGKELKRFRSLNSCLLPWETKTLDAYFDTKGLEKKDYRAAVVIKYEGASTSKDGIITIGENINAVVVEEIPGTFSFSQTVSGLFAFVSGVNIYIVIILFFIILSCILVFLLFRRQEQAEPIDEGVVTYIKELRRKYSDEYIKDLMIKKGWSADRVEKVFIAARK